MNKIIPLTKNKEFLSVYSKGKAFVTPYFVFYAKKNRSSRKRFGITTGKKCGNAVKRVRCRRLARVIYNENYDILPKGYDFVLIARPGMSEKKSTELSEIFKRKVEKFFFKNRSAKVNSKSTQKK